MEQKQLRDSQPRKDHPGVNREGPRRRRKGAPDLQPTRKRGPQSHGSEQLGSANKLSNLESLRASDRSPILLMLILGDPRQRAGPTPAPQAGAVICCGSRVSSGNPLGSQGLREDE